MNRKTKFCISSLLLIITLFFGSNFAHAQTDVARKTVAITYPLGEPVDVFFRGTTRFPRLKGQASIERKNKTGTKVNISLQNLPRPYELGEAYTTYILWAITPEGKSDNLGELKYRTGTTQDPRGSFTTPLQTFAMIVTAEPHYLVKEPSRAVILENVQPAAGIANIVNVQYFGNSSDYFRDPRTPEIADTDYVRTPVSLLGARQAVNMAKFAGAERDAAVEFEYATTSLTQAEAAYREGREEDAVDILARQAIAAGVKAEEVAGVRKIAREQRNEKARNDAEIKRAETGADDARRERDELRTELERERRNRELSERDTSNVSTQLSELRRENQTLRDELAKLRAESEDAKIRLASNETERRILEQQRQNEQRAARIRQNAPLLIQALKPFGAVRETARGIVVTLPENFWSKPREMNFAPTASQKIERLAQVLANNPDYNLLIESHTDDGGAVDVLQTLTDERARLLSSRFAEFGIQPTRLESKGLGASLPVAPNTTNASRAKNRRTEITFFVAEPTAEQTANN